MNTNQDTTLTNKDALIEAEFKDMYPYEDMSNWDLNLFKSGYLAATKASESEINALKEQVKELQSHLSSQVIEITQNDVILESYAHKVAELQANINELREAFLEIMSCYGDGYEVYNIARQAVSKTPTQSLQEHDNDVIERVALALENAEGEFKTLPEYVALVRGLKNE